MTIGYSWLLFTFNNHCHLAAGGPVSTEGRNPVNSQFHRPKQSWNRIETTLSWYTKNLHFWSMVFKGHITLCNIITCQIHHGPLTTNIYTLIYSHETHSQAGIQQDFWHGLTADPITYVWIISVSFWFYKIHISPELLRNGRCRKHNSEGKKK